MGLGHLVRDIFPFPLEILLVSASESEMVKCSFSIF